MATALPFIEGNEFDFANVSEKILKYTQLSSFKQMVNKEGLPAASRFVLASPHGQITLSISRVF